MTAAWLRRCGVLVSATMGLALLLTAGCGSSGSAPAPGETLAADFALMDDNPGSTTFGTTVSPRDHLGRISVWYFDEALAAAPT